MIQNPYAKRNHPTASSETTSRRNASESGGVPPHNNQQQLNRPVSTSSTTILQSIIPPLLLPQTTTFSQAFPSSSPPPSSPSPPSAAGAINTHTIDHTNNNHSTDSDLLHHHHHPSALNGWPDGITNHRSQPEANGNTGVPNHPPPILQFASDRDYHILQQQPHVLYVSNKQRGNPILSYIRNVPWSYSTMVPDYIFNSTACALYISLKYHILYRTYIHTRVSELKTDFTVRILLVLVDVDDNEKVLLELNTFAVKHNLTLILGWSEEEMARYLETYKVLNNRDAAMIQKSKDSHHNNFVDQMNDFFTACKGIHKTDAASMITQFQNLRAVTAATPDEFSLISGLGPIKVQRLYDAFHQPFSSKLSRQRKQQHQQSNK
jgi:DNA excision repair protein ERCC-1